MRRFRHEPLLNVLIGENKWPQQKLVALLVNRAVSSALNTQILVVTLPINIVLQLIEVSAKSVVHSGLFVPLSHI